MALNLCKYFEFKSKGDLIVLHSVKIMHHFTRRYSKIQYGIQLKGINSQRFHILPSLCALCAFN